MGFFVSSGLYSFIANLAIGAFVYVRNPRRKVNVLFALFSLTVSGWSFGSFLENVIVDKAIALWVLRFNYLFAVWLPSVYIHLVYVFTERTSTKNSIKLKISYFTSIALTPVVFTPLFIPSLRIIENTNYYISRPGILYYAFFAFFALGMTEVISHTTLQLHKYQGVRRTQMKYMTAANGIAIFAGFEYFSRVFGFFKSPPLDDYILVAYLAVVAYAIIRHQLLDIEVIFRRTLIFAGLTAFVFGVFSAATFIVRELLSGFLGASNLWTYAISIFLIVLGYDPIRNVLVNITDRFFFQKKYDYQKLLKDATKGISKIESLDHLFGLVTHFITMRMRVVNAAILTKSDDENRFSLEYQRGYEQNYLTYYVDQTAPLVQHLSTEKEPIDLEKVNEKMQARVISNKNAADMEDYDYQVIKKQMEELEAAVCIPSFLGNELRNILIIGPKKSGDYYSEDDLNVLYTLAQESAIAIENARLYDEAIKKTHELEKINEQLEGAKSQLTEALRETETANKQLQDTQAQLIHEQKMATLGRLAASVGHEVNNPLTILSMNVSRAVLKYRKNPDLKVNDILDVFQKMEQNISRIKAVVNTLTGLLKKSEKGKFEPLSLKLILEETLPLVQFQTYLDNLAGTEVEFNIPANLPLIRGDLERLQEVFLNLFINAYHAMSGRRNPRITVKADVIPGNEGMIAVNFNDNGKGMDEETVKKIFNYGFTTKPPGKGSGLGLYMCKYIVELHGGDIKVQSTPGVGTTFLLTIPAYSEESLMGNQPQAGMG